MLSDPEALALSDEALSRLLTETLSATGLLTSSGPVLLRRSSGLAVASLPDAAGLILIDGTQTLLLSPWNLGILDLQLYPAEDSLGVRYVRRASESASTQHFVLVRRVEGHWQRAWLSDDEALWWFNNRNASLEVSRDLSRLTLSGEARAATDLFIDSPSGPVRVFTLDWRRSDQTYQPDPDPGRFETRRAWMAQIAQPSPYDSLVQYIEALTEADRRSALALLADESLLDFSIQLGLSERGRRYSLLEAPQTSGSALRFGDEFGRYEVLFSPPTQLGQRWMISGIHSLDQAPTPTAAASP